MARKKQYLTIILAVVSLIGVGWLLITRDSISRNARSKSIKTLDPHSKDVVLASPGRVEGASEAIQISAGVDGVLEQVFVTEGDQVIEGQLLARIFCTDIKQAVNAAEAELEGAKKIRDRLIIGSRSEERLVAEHEAIASKAVMEESEKKYQRMVRLYDQKIVAEDDLLESKGASQVAEARYHAALERQNLVNAKPLPTEIEKANADISAADARKASLSERLEKCNVKAPLSGTVLRRHLEPGESVSITFPRPIITLANTKTLRVRAEIDERDIGLVKLGQQVLVTCDACADRKIQGKVQKKGILMGRKQVLTGDPGEKSDRDILEVLIALDDANLALPIGLRVTVQFLKP